MGSFPDAMGPMPNAAADAFRKPIRAQTKIRWARRDRIVKPPEPQISEENGGIAGNGCNVRRAHGMRRGKGGILGRARIARKSGAGTIPSVDGAANVIVSSKEFHNKFTIGSKKCGGCFARVRSATKPTNH
jgi:hypothetical protein